ncbi:uncharacterized protein LOC143546842 [Bidens hawaiensis]|uniref:uncharacterized protein LOC143546842 n=1 Tax=Bidens hawaiensis TaxID=980011 RepID=UPI00404B5823
MEGLHVAIEDMAFAGFFGGAGIGGGKFAISHIFYANDVIILGEWSLRNIKNMVMILNCFYLASGLKLNIHKSNLYGVGLEQREVVSFPNIIGCKPDNLPFLYLGLPVGAKMGSIRSWDFLVEKFKSKLSKWKANLLSIGGSTLITTVLGSLGIYYLSLFMLPVGVRKN